MWISEIPGIRAKRVGRVRRREWVFTVLQGRPRRRDLALSKAKTVEYERRLISETEQPWYANRGVFLVKISPFEARKSKP